MKKALLIVSFAMIGAQSMVAMNPNTDFERLYGSPEEQEKMRDHYEQTNIGYGRQASTRGQNLYQIIGVNPNATQSEISSAYRNKALQLKKAKQWEQMKNLNHAKDILTDPKARAEYDRTR